MTYRTKESVFCQVQLEHDNLASLGGLPFRDLLSGERVMAALHRVGVRFRDRIFTPMVTLWAFLSQVVTREGC